MILKWGILNAESCPWSMDSLTFTLRVFHQSGKFKSLIGRSGEINMPPPSGQFHSLSPRWTFLVLVRKNTVAMNPVYWTSCWTTSCADMSQSGLLIMIHKSAWCLSISLSDQQHENYQNYTFTLKGLRSGIERCIHNESPVSFLSHPSLKQLDHHAHLTQISRLHPFQQIAQCSQLSVQTSLLGPGSPHSKHISWDSGVSKKCKSRTSTAVRSACLSVDYLLPRFMRSSLGNFLQSQSHRLGLLLKGKIYQHKKLLSLKGPL